MKRIVIFGDRQFAELAYYQFTAEEGYEVVAFTIDEAYFTRSTFQGLPVVTYETLHKHFSKDDIYIFVAIGIAQCNRLRENKFNQVKADGYRLVSLVRTGASILGPLEIGENVMIMEGCYLHSNVKIGDNSILWSGSMIAMDCEIGANCWITKATMGEKCKVGKNTFIGIDATLIPKIEVGAYNIIDSGAIIGKNTKEGEFYRGFRSVASKLTEADITRRRLLE